MNIFAAMELPSSAVAIPVASMKLTPSPAASRIARLMRSGVERKIRIVREVARKNFRRVDDKSCLVAAHGGEHFLGAGDDEVAAEHQIGFAGGDSDGVNILGLCANLDMAVDGAAFLREARHVDRAAALAFKMRRHAQNGADGDNTGAADPGDEDAIGFGADRRKLTAVQARESPARV